MTTVLTVVRFLKVGNFWKLNEVFLTFYKPKMNCSINQLKRIVTRLIISWSRS